MGALRQGRRGQGREDLGGKRGIQKREEEAPGPSAAVALLCGPGSPLISSFSPSLWWVGQSSPQRKYLERNYGATIRTGTFPLGVLCASRIPDKDSCVLLCSAGAPRRDVQARAASYKGGSLTWERSPQKGFLLCPSLPSFLLSLVSAPLQQFLTVGSVFHCGLHLPHYSPGCPVAFRHE